ncbi:hypothetical protein N579_0113440 [Corynebacterium pseudodiphtheriticum 090104]|nr:hypothetical protein N579_0113440 [Corynebacterium pseudodiphtheriticum 090104]
MIKPPSRLFFNVVKDKLDFETIPIFIDEPDHNRGFGPASDAKSRGSIQQLIGIP